MIVQLSTVLLTSDKHVIELAAKQGLETRGFGVSIISGSCIYAVESVIK